jgi:predicted dehydrogenase
MEEPRRNFIKKTALGAAALTLGGILPGFSAKSYKNILGASDRIRVANMGVNARGLDVAQSFALQQNCEVLHVCDVDSRATEKCISSLKKIQKKHPRATPDFRKALDDKQVDALVVTAPDHWHVPAAILACKAGKHVYLEKPASHNPHEGELVVAAAEKYKRVIQMGNQRRSYPNVAAGIAELHASVIGKLYLSKSWYANNRQPIGIGKETAVPAWLNYELWQGPAPRKPFKDNIVHYNWHWFWHWGTAESGNTGTHQMDLSRWGLGVDFPIRVSSSGGRFHYQDDQETPDTQLIAFEFKDNKSITFEGRSCNGRAVDGIKTAVSFYGDKGSMLIDGNSYTIYDLQGKVLKEVKSDIKVDGTNVTSPSQQLDAPHIRNFLDGIRVGAKQTSDILGGHKSTLLSQLGNISLRTGRPLQINPENGHIVHDAEAMKFWKREYQPGWEPTL